MSKAEAREELQRCSGKQFDPVVVARAARRGLLGAREPERHLTVVAGPSAAAAAYFGAWRGCDYSVGDKVLVSRDENGEDHERGVVIDSYELIIGEERKPMVVVEFEDGERKYMTAATPNVLPVYEPEDGRGRRARTAEAVDEPDAELPADDEAHASGNGEVFFDDDERASP